MVGLPLKKIHRKLLCGALAFIISIIMSLSFGIIQIYAAEVPSLSVQIGSVQDGTASLESGSQGTALVFLDCSELVFKSGEVTLKMDASVFSEVSAKSDADVTSVVNSGDDVISIKYSFESNDGLKGIVQLGTVSFVLKSFESSSVTTEIGLSDIKFVDVAGTAHSDDFDVKNILVTVKGSNVVQNATPTATAEDQAISPTATANDATSGVLSSPKPTNKTQLLTDTEMYTLEDVEDLSKGAIVFWGLVFMVIGVWIGLGLGYWIWCKRRKKPQVKDTHSNVIGHLK